MTHRPPARSPARPLARLLARDRRGASVVEHALILPAFLLLVLLILEVGWQFAVGAALDHGARRAARWVSLGQAAPAGTTREQQVSRLVVQTAGLPLDAARLTVTPTAFASHAGINAGAAGTAGLGAADSVVRYVVRYRAPALTPLTAALVPGRVFDHRAVVIEQNEPYPGA